MVVSLLPCRSKRHKSGSMEDDIDTSPSGEYYTSPNSPASSSRNWPDEMEGGEWEPSVQIQRERWWIGCALHVPSKPYRNIRGKKTIGIPSESQHMCRTICRTTALPAAATGLETDILILGLSIFQFGKKIKTERMTDYDQLSPQPQVTPLY